MPDQAAVIQELYNRLATLPPDKQAVVGELAKRYGIGQAPPDAGARMQKSALAGVESRMGDQNETFQRPSNPYGGAPLVETPVQAPAGTPGAGAINAVNPVVGAQQMANGASQITQGTPKALAGGASQVIRGAMHVAAPALLATPAAAIPELAGSIALGKGASDVTEGGLKAVGVPNEYAELAGDVAGIAAPSAVHTGAGGDLLNTARDAVADKLHESAEKNISTALAPTRDKLKAITADTVAPGLIERGVIARSREHLADIAEQKLSEHGEALNDRYDALAAKGVEASAKPIVAALQTAIDKNTVGGVIQDKALVAKLQGFQDDIQKVAENNGGKIPLDQLRQIRQFNDTKIAGSKAGYALGIPDAVTDVQARREYANATRQVINGDPVLAKLNKESSFWNNVSDVVGATIKRSTGQKPGLGERLAETGGTFLGTHAAGVPGGFVGKYAGRYLARLTQSTLWSTLSAQAKTKIADAISTGDVAGAQAAAKQAGVVLPNASQIAANASQSTGVANGQRTSTNTGTAPQGNGVSAALQSTGQGQAGGSATTVKVPGQSGAGYAAEYKLRELDDINGSHNGLTFQANPEYKLTNDRNYANKVNQGKVVNAATDANFDPKFHLTDNPDATNGPVITDSKGNIVGGNGRAMILQRAYQAGGKAAASYRQMLGQRAGQFGLDPAEVDNFKHPVLTREIPDTEFAAKGGKQTAVTDFNKVGTAALTPAERSISDSKRVSEDTLNSLSSLIEAGGEKATLASVLEGKGGPEVLKKLIADGVISPQEQAGLGTADALTKEGKARIAQLVVGRFFDSPDQIEATAPAIRAKVERLAAPLAAVEKAKDFNLTPDVKDAIALTTAAKAAGIPSIDDYLEQDGLFGKQKYSARAIALAKAFKTAKSVDLLAAARQYAQDAAYADQGQTLLGDAPTPAEAFAESFGKVKSGAAAEKAAKGK